MKKAFNRIKIIKIEKEREREIERKNSKRNKGTDMVQTWRKHLQENHP